MQELLTSTFIVGLIAATLRVATPLIFATVGEIYSERSGVLNLGIEGIMFLGAFVGFAVAKQSEGLPGNLWIGLLTAAPTSPRPARLDPRPGRAATPAAPVIPAPVIPAMSRRRAAGRSARRG